jgi:hypothetical protein
MESRFCNDTAAIEGDCPQRLGVLFLSSFVLYHPIRQVPVETVDVWIPALRFENSEWAHALHSLPQGNADLWTQG